MEQLLVLPNTNALLTSEKEEIEEIIEQTIALHKGNGLMITKLTMESITALTTSEARSNELGQQRFEKGL